MPMSIPGDGHPRADPISVRGDQDQCLSFTCPQTRPMFLSKHFQLFANGKWKTTCPTGTPKQATAERVTWPACDVLSVLLEAMSTRGPRCWKYAQEALIKLFIIIFHVYDNCLLSML